MWGFWCKNALQNLFANIKLFISENHPSLKIKAFVIASFYIQTIKIKISFFKLANNHLSKVFRHILDQNQFNSQISHFQKQSQSALRYDQFSKSTKQKQLVLISSKLSRHAAVMQHIICFCEYLWSLPKNYILKEKMNSFISLDIDLIHEYQIRHFPKSNSLKTMSS